MNTLQTPYETGLKRRLKEPDWPLRQPPDPEVMEKPKRRHFTAEYKLRILHEAEACAPGELGALLRREGLYSSNLTSWRRQRAKGELAALSAKPRGRKVKPNDARTKRIIELERKNQQLLERLKQAELIIEVQKKVAALLNEPLKNSEKF
jgi:transposase-like protein